MKTRASSMKVEKAHRKKGPNTCSCCGKQGHRLEKCRLPGAKLLLQWQARARSKESKRRPLQYKDSVKMIVGKSCAENGGGFSKRHLQKTDISKIRSHGSLPTDAAGALRVMQRIQFLPRKPRKCPICRKGKLSGPAPFTKDVAGKGHLYYRCTRNACNVRVNVTSNSVVAKTRLGLPDLLRVLTYYCRCGRMKAPKVYDACRQLQLGATQVQHVFDALRSREARRGRTYCASKARLTGNVRLMVTCCLHFEWGRGIHTLSKK